MDAIEVVHDAVLEGYAISIPNRLLAERLGCNDINEIEIERERFREFLYEIDIKFLSNIDAWEIYNFDLELMAIMEELDLYAPDDYSDGRRSWMADIEKALEDKARPSNYNEHRGQQ
jgi:hypothetical protein